MVQYLIAYSVQTGKEQEHDRWLHAQGWPFWRRQQGFRDLRAYSTLVGTGPDWVVEVDFDSADNLVRALDSAEAQPLLEDFERLVTDLSTKILVPAAAPVSAG